MSKINTEFIINEQAISYEIFNNGYDIFLGDNPVAWITQRDQYSKIILPNGTYEENAIAQITDLAKSNEESKNQMKTQEQNSADIAYFGLINGVEI